jgi:hypothetical protein
LRVASPAPFSCSSRGVDADALATVSLTGTVANAAPDTEAEAAGGSAADDAMDSARAGIAPASASSGSTSVSASSLIMPAEAEAAAAAAVAAAIS